MNHSLTVHTGQSSQAGRKAVNQDFHALLIPNNHQRLTKGIAVVIADGISSSNVSQVASESAVAGFLSDYYSTPDSWSVKQSAQRVIRATNAWLHAQTRQSRYRYDQDRGYVCTFSALILKSASAHLFHVGDARIYRLQGNSLEQLTTDHRVWLSAEDSCLNRALGLSQQLDIDYLSLPVYPGDTFVLATDGVYEHVTASDVTLQIATCQGDLDQAAQSLVDLALARGSEDNLTLQIVQVTGVPDRAEDDSLQQAFRALPFAPEQRPGDLLDGYRIVRQIHASSRSHVYLAVDEASGRKVALKFPAVELREHPDELDRFATERWIAQRLRNPHVAPAFGADRQQSYLYLATAFVEGCSLRQWMLDYPRPDLETVRQLAEQIIRGLRAFHRLEMVHQDLKPENILIDPDGRITLIDFGATRVAGLQEARTTDTAHPLGAALYSAPELFLGEPGTPQADQFSLGVIVYQMLTGRLPYNTQVPRIGSRKQQKALQYQPARAWREDLPAWLDTTLARATHPEPHRRYPALSELLHDLRHPGQDWQARHQPPLVERHPVRFWQGVSAVLLLALIASLAMGPVA
ncbi:MAG: bifunctional protein-serine/threonine kinase/phosphatase [Pseudomonadota bacterium]|nr:bifunctional protein-serine/threonine kinase/phosphatase [Pseudomonadota bacterium]